MDRITVSLICFAMLILCCLSCSFDSSEVYTDETTEEYELYDYYIDSYGNEGIVAYNSPTKKIVISSDESFLSWGPMGELVYKSDSISFSYLTSPYFGTAVHQIMKSMGVGRYPAQAWCDLKNMNEQFPRAGSWRLPSYRELRLIFEDGVEELNKALLSIGGSIIDVNNLYWTCVEDFDNYIQIEGVSLEYDKENCAIMTSPNNSTYSYKDRRLKKNKYFVRAIKYVYYGEK